MARPLQLAAARMAVSPVSSSSPEAAAATQDPGTWVVQPGDTLSGIARQLQGAGLAGTTASGGSSRAIVEVFRAPDGKRQAKKIRVGPRVRNHARESTRPESAKN